ncbi:substrate-binding domain-containing protein [Nevskia sp.]|uniref:substrate-binding domain-containing protein n=1 Tax=Nevskia sp. TaxID=1929292 RepID=UPI0025E867A9|nr:substrate-binding domain-containing protein [Nevskia sp.]
MLAASGIAVAAPAKLVIGVVPSLGPAAAVLDQAFTKDHAEVEISVRVATATALSTSASSSDAPDLLLLDSLDAAKALIARSQALGDSLTPVGDGLLAIYTNTPGVNTGRGAPLFVADYITGIAVSDRQASPFGQIARDVLERLTLLELAEKKFRLFPDDAAAAAAVKAAEVDIGLIPVPLLVSAGYRNIGSSTALPLGLYTPAAYTAVITRDSAAARAYLAFLQAKSTQPLLTDVGIVPASIR